MANIGSGLIPANLAILAEKSLFGSWFQQVDGLGHMAISQPIVKAQGRKGSDWINPGHRKDK